MIKPIILLLFIIFLATYYFLVNKYFNLSSSLYLFNAFSVFMIYNFGFFMGKE